MEAGRTQAQIAALCGLAQSTVSDLSKQKIRSPSYEVGQRLVDLHKEVCRDAA